VTVTLECKKEKTIMYVRVTTGNFDPAKEQELQQLTDEKYIPLTRQLPGFHSYLSGIDRAAGRFVSITVWDSLDHAQAFPAAITHLLGEFTAASLRPEPTQVFEVIREV
jgi:hypothetical protein